MKRTMALVLIVILSLTFALPVQASPFPSMTKMTVGSYWVDLSGKTTLVSKLVSPDGKAIAGKPVKFFVGGKYAKSVNTDRKGVAKLVVDVPAGKVYQVKVAFDGDTEYYGSFNYMSLITLP